MLTRRNNWGGLSPSPFFPCKRFAKSAHPHPNMTDQVSGIRLIITICLLQKVCKVCPSTSKHDRPSEWNTQFFRAKGLQSLPIHIQTWQTKWVEYAWSSPFVCWHPITSEWLFCLYRHNTRLNQFVCEQVCKTCPSTSNCLTLFCLLWYCLITISTYVW